MGSNELYQYLKVRPIGAILENFPQQRCERALKLLCIVDQYIDDRNLYVELEKRPKMMSELMQFDYCIFKYFDYQIIKRTEDCLLKCRYCGIVATYALILTHTAIRHNVHLGLNMCEYCKMVELSAHNQHQFNACYGNYIKMNKIEKNVVENAIVAEFHVALKKVAREIGVVVHRNRWYGGVLQTELDIIIRSHGHDFPQLVYATTCKWIDDQKLDEAFKSVERRILGDGDFGLAPAVQSREIGKQEELPLVAINEAFEMSDPNVEELSSEKECSYTERPKRSQAARKTPSRYGQGNIDGLDKFLKNARPIKYKPQCNGRSPKVSEQSNTQLAKYKPIRNKQSDMQPVKRKRIASIFRRFLVNLASDEDSLEDFFREDQE